MIPPRLLRAAALFASVLLASCALAGVARSARAAEPAAGLPATAVAALDRAAAAYEYGDMTQVVDSTRPIVEGALLATPAERLEALRLQGIGLYLIGRPLGAEGAFLELLRARPKARLDPTTTRPEVVAFFEDVRRRHAPEIQDAARARSRKSFVWNLLPPVGQFKNGDRGRGYVILGLEVATLAGAVTTKVVLDSWQQPDGTFRVSEELDRTTGARALKTWNHIAIGAFAATWAAGVVDAILRSDREPEEPAAGVSFFVVPGGAGLRGTF